LGRRLITVQTIKLIDLILRAGGPRMSQFGATLQRAAGYTIAHSFNVIVILGFKYCKANLFVLGNCFMTWIRTIPDDDADDALKEAQASQRHLYPAEYAIPIHPTPDGSSSQIVASHSLIPQALYHAFATFGSLMSPDLPLSRRHHEMIATMVSVTNRCVY